MSDSLMYKMSYYRFGETKVEAHEPWGYDRVRQAQIGKLDVKLDYFEEAFTSEKWYVRIYRKKARPNRDFMQFTGKNLLNEDFDQTYSNLKELDFYVDHKF